MKKYFILLITIAFISSCCAFAATKYKVNTSGVVKTGGNVISSPSNAVNQNFYNNYSAQSYVSSNIVNANPVGTVEIVMDFSGSMANWIGVAKRSMLSIVAQISPSTNLGFRVFGHDNYGHNPSNVANLGEVQQIVKNGKKLKVITQASPIGSTTGVCAATQQVAPIAPANAASIISGMNTVNLGGATPLVYALERTVNSDFAGLDNVSPKKIVLITDGGENCGGDPCEFAKRLMQKRSDVHIDVVLVSSSSKALSCLASTTGGHFYNINNLADFSNTMTQSIQSQPTVAPIQVPEQNYEFIKD